MHHSQRDMMRGLLTMLGYDEAAVCRAYAQAERAGLVSRKSNKHGHSAEAYAAALWANGHRRRSPWIREYCTRHGITAKTHR